MLQRITRVSEAQWSIILEFLERNPNLARARGYNNSARGRQESTRINYKSKLKKIVADINADSSGTGGGPPRGSNWSEVDQRFLAILGPGFGQTAPQVSVNPFPDADQQQPSTSTVLRAQDVSPEDVCFMYANTIAEAELNMSTLSEDVKVKTNNKLQNYLTNMWARREGHAYNDMPIRQTPLCFIYKNFQRRYIAKM
ncbi:hypothetical protein ABMA28_008120 [Loxostege sticticalis]|uniref:Uncharacterized protein n=1 Tax=Loxostege sticticalis TaxID=481309 RepID=A0ABD0SG23_LOXSC